MLQTIKYAFNNCPAVEVCLSFLFFFDWMNEFNLTPEFVIFYRIYSSKICSFFLKKIVIPVVKETQNWPVSRCCFFFSFSSKHTCAVAIVPKIQYNLVLFFQQHQTIQTLLCRLQTLTFWWGHRYGCLRVTLTWFTITSGTAKKQDKTVCIKLNKNIEEWLKFA